MDLQRLDIPDVVLIMPKKHGDDRGYFSEVYNQKTMKSAGVDITFIQDNQAFSAKKGTVRGLHFQTPPMAQTKLVRVLSGAILDVAVDLRKSSKTYGQHVSTVLSVENWAQLLVPRGFAHGYCTLEPNTAVFYKVDQYYSPEHDKGLAWDDPDLAISWTGADADTLSSKDRCQPSFSDLPFCFP